MRQQPPQPAQRRLVRKQPLQPLQPMPFVPPVRRVRGKSFDAQNFSMASMKPAGGRVGRVRQRGDRQAETRKRKPRLSRTDGKASRSKHKRMVEALVSLTNLLMNKLRRLSDDNREALAKCEAALTQATETTRNAAMLAAQVSTLERHCAELEALWAV